MIIDEIIANDPIKKEIMKLSRPANKAISIIDKKTAIDNFVNEKYKEQKIFVISREFTIISDLLNLGLEIPNINIGMHFSKEQDYMLTNRIVISKKNFDIIKGLVNRGIKFEAQYVPSDEKEDLTLKILNW